MFQRAFKFIVLTLLVLPGALLFAQLDPKLQSSKTDFMDLYQSTGSKKTKPEIVTVLDMSGSMLRMMFHPGFPNNDDDEDTTNTTSDYKNMQVILTGTAPNINATVTWSAGTTIVSALTVSGTNVYTFNGAAAPYAPTNATTQYKQLIRPDGTYVTYAIANTINGPNTPAGNISTLPGIASGGADARNWVRAASHVRMSMVDPDNGNLRTVDIPINWAVLGQYDADGNWIPPTVTNPLSRATVTNTDGTVLDIDSTYRGTDSSNCFLRANGTTKAIIGASSGSTQSYRTRYLEWIFRAKEGNSTTGAYIIPDAVASYKAIDPSWWDDTTKARTYITAPRVAFANKLPNRARVQALKEAFLKTWIKYQNDVLWAWRTLSDDGISPSNDTGTQPSGLTEANLDTGNTTYSGAYSRAGSRYWFLQNKDSLGGMRLISKMYASDGTPLVVSQIGTYTQLQNINPFASYETSTNSNAASECMRIFCLMFTDGTPTAGGIQTGAEAVAQQPYSGGALAGNNAVVAAGLASLNSGGTYANMSTYAGVAAHLGTKILTSSWVDSKAKTYPTSGTPSQFAPWFVKSRGTGIDAITFNSPRPIQTMTIGMSLGSNYSGTFTSWKPDTMTPDPIATTPSTPKYRLLAAAVYGNPDDVDYNIASATSFTTDAQGQPTTNSSYYFDAISAKKLVDSLDAAFDKMKSLASQSVTATPVAPFSGLTLAKQIYLGSFEVPKTPGPLWSGDLMMFPTRTVNNQTTILAQDGSTLTEIDSNTAATQAQWSAKKILNAANYWSTRKIYTRAKGSATGIKNPGLSEFTDTTGTGKFDDFKGLIQGATDADKQKLVRWMRGADAYSATAPTAQRPNLMGDIIDSTPTALEFSTSFSGMPSSISTALASHSGSKFRLVFAGTNDGFLHAFGEVTWDESVTQGGQTFTMTKGTATELWSFIPTDILPFLSYLAGPGNPHRFTVDGAPLVYHLDVASSGQLAGNGKVDPGERAMVVFGLRKGGRSFYALDVSDPFNPKMGWALRAEEADVIATDSARNLSSTTLAGATTGSGTIQDIVDRLGFSTGVPAIGRVLFTDGGALRARDAVFLSGGLSLPEVEANFLDTSGKPKKLGRSVLALDVSTGAFLRTWDLTNIAGMGPVPAGVVPHQFFPSSGLVQRAYFTDMAGGLWALGSGYTSTTAPYVGMRMDSSELDRWTMNGTAAGAQNVRHIYQGPTNEIHSTLPAPFNLGNYPVYRTSDPKIAPSAVGVAFVSGDRNNPLDLSYAAGKAPTGHRINVVFDRQDSFLLGLDTSGMTTNQMADMSTQTSTSAPVIDPSSPSYYLLNKYGYYINFPGPFAMNGSTFIPKGINEPTVLAGVLFYTYFKPTSGDPCNPGAGLSRSWRVCDVINPTVSSGAAPVGTPTGVCTAGFVMEWAGVASNFGAKSTVAVNQAGGVLAAGGGGDSGTGAGTGKVAIGTATGSLSEAYPKPRVWRSVHSNL